ncbi:MAG: PC4/YdbC family ssDNA-binding protein [Anaerovoracaceae bacterium]
MLAPATYPTGWRKELNLVSWNGGAPKYDIRDWDPDHERMSRGITLHEKEMRLMDKHGQAAQAVEARLKGPGKNRGRYTCH